MQQAADFIERVGVPFPVGIPDAVVLLKQQALKLRHEVHQLCLRKFVGRTHRGGFQKSGEHSGLINKKPFDPHGIERLASIIPCRDPAYGSSGVSGMSLCEISKRSRRRWG